MTFKKINLLILSIFILLFSVTTVIAKPYETITDQVHKKIEIIINAVNKSDHKEIYKLLSPNASDTLKQEIQRNLNKQEIIFQQEIKKIERISDNKILVKGPFSAKGRSSNTQWNINGPSNYFIFEKIDQDWYLLESNFAKKLNLSYIQNILKMFILITLTFIFLIFSFWIWMLVDAIERDIPNKTFWILIIVLMNWLGAILYFFIVRRKHIKSLR